MKVPVNVPSTNWLPRSRMKFDSTSGPYCCEVSDSTTIVSEKTTPATVIMELATVDSTARAPSGLST